MLYDLHKAAALKITARLPADNQIFRVSKARPCIHPEDTRPKLVLCCTVSEQPPRLGRCIMRLKTALHHEKYVYVMWLGLSSNVAPEDDESLQKT
jgi:hypothetical protein